MATAPIHMNAAWPLAALALLLASSPALAAVCTLEDDVDFRGSDINNGASNIVTSAQACCDQCGRNSRCESWTYVKVPSALGTGRQVGECWLKNARRNNVISSDCCISGVAPARCDAEVGYDYRGSDINNGASNIVTSPQACCDQCARDSRCRSWTYVKTPSALGTGRKVGECWLKDRVKPGRQRNDCCTSGVA
ncbi:unnamed protein product [Ostreobium quekettii]|uniref:Apple domain-containing protein n=1 Tax=Ostreobium quekettii TaxID=121088 RepID=A0A8S1J3Y7_9CHLO|nr:unnamed protein product [Ostreobium quekettii]